MNRALYFVYYLRGLNYKVLSAFTDHAKLESKRSGIQIFSDMLASTFRYNISILDYFYFRFYKLSGRERKKWAGTGFMYEYQRKMNPASSRDILADKSKFYDSYAQFIKRRHIDISRSFDDAVLASLLSNPEGRLVLKDARGQVGAEVEVINCKDYDPLSLKSYMGSMGYNLIEEYVVQHPRLMELSPSGLNTLRIITQLNGKGDVDILGARLRISVNSQVDNMAAGNLAAPVDLENGIISGPGVYSDIRKPDESIHPVTGIAIEGFHVPYWPICLEMAKTAALLHPENKSIGWDIAITGDGPELIEGNHNWCKLLWQLPVKQGLKHVLRSYLD